MSAPEMSAVKRALVELRELRARLDAAEADRAAARAPIAVIGMGCRLPGASGPDALWQLLLDGTDAVTEVPADRWNADAWYDRNPAAPGRMSTRWGGFIDDVAGFDPGFFGISPREANALDPQHRLLLEVAWEALEHAGQAPDRLRGSATGVWVGISSFDYAHLAMGAPPEAIDAFLASGIAHSAASGRLSYQLGLQGPSVSLDTACSSSLMAVHQAVRSLRTGECRQAIAAGVNAILVPGILVGFTKAQMMAADGRCRTFDARADGFVRGEGCGVVVLKRLDDALADGDRVWAVIRGSAANQDGRSSGMTAPNGLAQEAVVRAALRDAGVEPRAIGYVEAHGTGTALGDPIEVQALGGVLAEGRAPDRPVLVGSIKTNIGHTEAAAGVAGLIKATLALHHRVVPPSLHFDEPNPFIPWASLPVRVATSSTPFPAADDGRCCAGVSSLGFTGTNVHVVLEDAPRATGGTTQEDRAVRALKLSARTPAALDALADAWTAQLAGGSAPFAALCATANTGRADLPERLVICAGTAAEAGERLLACRDGADSPGVIRGTAAAAEVGVTFLFSGHGGQRAGMGRELYETEPVFRAAVDECDALLRPHLDTPLLEVLYGAEAGTLLERMRCSQPALFAIEYALARLWQSWGVTPAVVLGHSVGEYAAAVIAGVLEVADGLRLVAARGRLMEEAAAGAMLAIFAAEPAVAGLLAPFAGRVEIAAVNGPTEVVVSGDTAAVAGLAAALAAAGIEHRRLAVAAAAHSHLLDPILDRFEAVAATVTFHEPRIELVSCTTGRPATFDEIGTPRYWRRHLRETVRFGDALAAVHDEGCRRFIEIGPHPSLCGMGARCRPDAGALWAPSLRRDTGEREQVLASLGALYVSGVAVDWTAVERAAAPAGLPRHRPVTAPTYPWQHRRCWLEHAAVPASAGAEVWDLMLAAGRAQERQGPLDLAIDTFPDRWHALARLTTAIVADTLARVGAFAADDPPVNATRLVDRRGVLPRYRLLVERWLRRLADADLLTPVDGGYRPGPAAAPDLDAAWDSARHVVADWPFMLEYLQNCATLLPDVITGRQNALETVFPGGSFATADALYRDSVLPRYYNTLAGAVLQPLLERRGAAVRVLEIGAGTGGTTATLAPLVERAGGSYHFTDVTPLFLARAGERLGALRCLTFGMFDVDADPVEQGLQPGSFDVIVAANVLHTVRDLPGTLRRVRDLLAPGGVLLLIEVTHYLDWFDVSTALLEGWDRQADGLRGEHPMLDTAAWAGALREAGFAEVAAFPGPDSPAAAMAQHVLLAQTPLRPSDPSTTTVVPARSGHTAPISPAHAVTDPTRLAARLAGAAPHEREDLLVDHVRRNIAALLRLDPAQPIDRRARLMELGLDSLMAVELRARLGAGLPLIEPLPATLVFDCPTVDAIVARMAALLDPAPHPADAGPAAVPGAVLTSAATAEVDDLTDDEIEARLLARVESIEGQLRQSMQ